MNRKTCKAILLFLIVLGLFFTLAGCEDLVSGFTIDDSEQTEYLIVFRANGGTGAMNDQRVPLNQSVTLSANQFVKEDHTFSGWSTTADGDAEYEDEGAYTHTERSDVTLYALWKVRIDETDTDGADTDDTDYDQDVDIPFTVGEPFPVGVETAIEFVLTPDLHRGLTERWFEPIFYRWDGGEVDYITSLNGNLAALPLVSIIVDGDLSDWDGVEPFVSDEEGDADEPTHGTDLTDFYLGRGGNDELYVGFRLADNQPNKDLIYVFHLADSENFGWGSPGFAVYHDGSEWRGSVKNGAGLPDDTEDDSGYELKDLDDLEYRGMVVVSGGTFSQVEAYTDGTEGGSFQHTISEFEIANYLVTYELWYTVRVWAEDNGYAFANPGCEGSSGTTGGVPSAGRKHEPVIEVSWRDTIVWLNAYSEMAGLTSVYYTDATQTIPIKDSNAAEEVQTATGSIDNPYVNWGADGYRLPTEGEWQYAASYQDGTTWTLFNYASGATADYTDATATDAVAWYEENSGGKTQTVGTKTANELGIHDMSGNVWEWAWDWHDGYPGPQTDYRGPVAGSNRVIRSGSWYYIAEVLQVGFRYADVPWDGDSGFGFRPARSVDNGASETYSIGDTGPAGGIVFFINPDHAQDGWRYLEAWTDDDPVWGQWKTGNTDTPGTATDIGSGYDNTYIAMAEADHTIAEIARAATHGGYSDWFIPSKDELDLMYEQRETIGITDLANPEYWSSSQHSEESVWVQSFSDGILYNWQKTSATRFRLIRRF